MPSSTYVGAESLVILEVSAIPPWSMPTSTSTLPRRIVRSIARVMSRGDNRPGSSTAPMTTSASAIAPAKRAAQALSLPAIACVVMRDGMPFELEHFTAFCVENLPKLMRPKYVEVLVQLPKTPNEKIAKYKLKEHGRAGPSGTTLDVETGGIAMAELSISGPRAPGR